MDDGHAGGSTVEEDLVGVTNIDQDDRRPGSTWVDLRRHSIECFIGRERNRVQSIREGGAECGQCNYGNRGTETVLNGLHLVLLLINNLRTFKYISADRNRRAHG